jgi:hypothetical protein
MSRAKDEKSKVRLIKDEISKENKPVKRASIIKPKKKTDTARRRRALFERVCIKNLFLYNFDIY